LSSMLHLQAILESHNKRQHIAPAALTRNKLLARVAGVTFLERD